DDLLNAIAVNVHGPDLLGMDGRRTDPLNILEVADRGWIHTVVVVAIAVILPDVHAHRQRRVGLRIVATTGHVDNLAEAVAIEVAARGVTCVVRVVGRVDECRRVDVDPVVDALVLDNMDHATGAVVLGDYDFDVTIAIEVEGT